MVVSLFLAGAALSIAGDTAPAQSAAAPHAAAASERPALPQSVRIDGDQAVIRLSGKCDPTLDFQALAKGPGGVVATPERKCRLAIQQCKTYECMKAAWEKFLNCIWPNRP